jgi:hypothetical protein
MAYCVMVHGPCRGKLCDFWARVKIRKRTVEDLVQSVRESIVSCDNGSSLDIKQALAQYWTALGVKDLQRLCREEPDLCSKISEVEQQVGN